MTPLTSQKADALLRANPRGVVYLIGIGGCGVSGLAHLLLDLGHSVVGSDLVSNEETRQLSARGAQIHTGHCADHVKSAGPALLIYSSAIRNDNPELQEAGRLGIPVVRRAVALSALVHRQAAVCV